MNEIIPPNEGKIIDAGRRELMFKRLTWVAWWGGTALIVGSWLNVVSNRVGWIGFGIACGSSLLSVIVGKYWRFPQ